jgi:hypothetical protein
MFLSTSTKILDIILKEYLTAFFHIGYHIFFKINLVEVVLVISNRILPFPSLCIAGAGLSFGVDYQ